MHCFRYPSYVSYSPIRLRDGVHLKLFGEFRHGGSASDQRHGIRLPAITNLTLNVGDRRQQHSFGERHG